MEPGKHPSATRRFGAPANWDQERDGLCGALDIADVVDQGSGAAVMESLWRPSREEMEALLKGGAIILGIFGSVHPVVYVGVSPPPAPDPLPVPPPPPPMRETRDGFGGAAWLLLFVALAILLLVSLPWGSR